MDVCRIMIASRGGFRKDNYRSLGGGGGKKYCKSGRSDSGSKRLLWVWGYGWIDSRSESRSERLS